MSTHHLYFIIHRGLIIISFHRTPCWSFALMIPHWVNLVRRTWLLLKMHLRRVCQRVNTFTEIQEPTNWVKFLGAQWFLSMLRCTFCGKSNCCIWLLLLLRKNMIPSMSLCILEAHISQSDRVLWFIYLVISKVISFEGGRERKRSVHRSRIQYKLFCFWATWLSRSNGIGRVHER